VIAVSIATMFLNRLEYDITRRKNASKRKVKAD
jgi:hypothetical protein